MNSYEIVEAEAGDFFVRGDGTYLHSDIVDLVMELSSLNPRFAKLWLEMAQEYVFLNTGVGEA